MHTTSSSVLLLLHVLVWFNEDSVYTCTFMTWKTIYLYIYIYVCMYIPNNLRRPVWRGGVGDAASHDGTHSSLKYATGIL